MSDTTSWTSATGGDFNTAANWSAGVPTVGVSASITEPATDPITVTYAGGADEAYALTTSDIAFSQSGGTLTLQTASTLSSEGTSLGAFAQTGGLIDFQNAISNNNSSLIEGQGSGVIQTAGTLEVDAGSLEIKGNSSFTGAIIGDSTGPSGTVIFGGGATFAINRGAAITTGAWQVVDSATQVNIHEAFAYGGAFYLGGDDSFTANTATLDIAQYTFTLTATATADWRGQIIGSGVIKDQGAATINAAYFFGVSATPSIAGSAVLDVTGALDIAYNFAIDGTASITNAGQTTQTAALQIGDASGAVATVTNSGTWTISAASSITTGAATASSFTDTGLLQITGAGTTTIGATFTETARGRVAIASGDLLRLAGASTLAGSVTGAGALNVYGGNLTIAAGATISVADLGFYADGTLTLGENLAYAGSFSDQTFENTTSLDLAGYTLSLAGPAAFTDAYGNAIVNGPGTLALSGATTLSTFVLGGTASLQNTGSVSDTGPVQIGDASGLLANITNAATWLLTTGDGINTGANTSSSFTNTGLFEKNGSGDSIIYAAFTSTGTVDSAVATAAISFDGGGSFAGAIDGAGTIDFADSRDYTIASGTTVSAAAIGIYGNNTDVSFSGSESYAGTAYEQAGAILTLSTGAKLSLTGSATLAGTLNGAGIVVLAGTAATLVTDNLTLGGSVELEDNQGTIAQQGNWTIGDSATSTANLRILAASTYVVAGNVSLYSNGTGRIANLGTFEKLDGTGTATIDPLMTNSGAVIAASGVLEFAQNFTNEGTATASNGNQLYFAATLTGAPHATGTVDLTNGGNVYIGGYIDATQTIAFTDASASLATIHSPGSFAGTISGFSGSNQIDLQGIQNVGASYAGTTSAGTLTLTENVGGNQIVVAKLDFAGDFTLSSFAITNDGSGGTLIQDPPRHAGTPGVTAVAGPDQSITHHVGAAMGSSDLTHLFAA